MHDTYQQYRWLVDIHEGGPLATLITQPAIVFEYDQNVHRSYLTDDQFIKSVKKEYHGTTLQIISLGGPSKLVLSRVQLVEGESPKLHHIMHYTAVEGRFTGYALHPSFDYIVGVTNQSRAYVFKLQNGECRGSIKLPYPDCLRCAVDPSGLYFATLACAQHKVVIAEIGTGKVAAEIGSLFEVSNLVYSPCGQYLWISSAKGTVAVFKVSAQMGYNVRRVVEMVQAVPSYWSQVQIYLPDFEAQPRAPEP